MPGVRLALDCLRQITFRTVRRDWFQYSALLATMGIALAGYLSIEIATRSAITRFEAINQIAPQASDWVIRSAAGGVSEATLQSIRLELDTLPVFLVPVLEQPIIIQSADTSQRPATLLASDLFVLNNFAASTPPIFNGESFSYRAAYTSGEYLEELGFVSGEPVRIQIQDTLREITLIAIDTAQQWPPRTLLMDYPSAKELIGEATDFDRIEVFVEPGSQRDKVWAATGQKLLDIQDDGLRIVSREEAASEGERLTQSFRYNLKLLTFIALLAALYLLLQVMDTSVTRRRSEISILRSLGLSRRWIERFWLLESLMLGLVGSTLGILLSLAFARYAYLLVNKTVTDLYLGSGDSVFSIQLQDILVGYAIGLTISLLAGWRSARLAAQTPPAQIMARGDWSPPGTLESHSFLALLFILAGGGALFIPPLALSGGSRLALGGILAALLWMAGGGALSSRILRKLAQRVRGSFKLPSAQFALSRLAVGSSRYSLAVAGLFVATAMAGSVLVLVNSLDQVLRVWMNQRLQADVYIVSNVNQNGGLINGIRAETWRTIAEQPSVQAAEIRQGFEVSINNLPTYIAGTNSDLALEKELWLWLQAPQASAASELPLAYISESFSLRFNKRRGDTVSLPTATGPRTVFIAGVYTDYGNERGSLTLDRSLTREWFGTDAALSMSLYLKAGSDFSAFVEALQLQHPGLTIRQTDELHALVLDIFQDTFAITELIQGVALLIAVSGLALALISMILDSRREWHILHELGMSPQQIGWISGVEGLSMAAMGGLLGLLASYPLGWILIEHINKPSFGWSMPIAMPWPTLLLYLVILVTTATLIGYWIGRRTARQILNS